MKKWLIVVLIIVALLVIAGVVGFFVVKGKVGDEIQKALAEYIPEGEDPEEYIKTLEPDVLDAEGCEKAKGVPSALVPDYARHIYDNCLAR